MSELQLDTSSATSQCPYYLGSVGEFEALVGTTAQKCFDNPDSIPDILTDARKGAREILQRARFGSVVVDLYQTRKDLAVLQEHRSANAAWRAAMAAAMEIQFTSGDAFDRLLTATRGRSGKDLKVALEDYASLQEQKLHTEDTYQGNVYRACKASFNIGYSPYAVARRVFEPRYTTLMDFDALSTVIAQENQFLGLDITTVTMAGLLQNVSDATVKDLTKSVHRGLDALVPLATVRRTVRKNFFPYQLCLEGLAGARHARLVVDGNLQSFSLLHTLKPNEKLPVGISSNACVGRYGMQLSDEHAKDINEFSETHGIAGHIPNVLRPIHLSLARMACVAKVTVAKDI